MRKWDDRRVSRPAILLGLGGLVLAAWGIGPGRASACSFTAPGIQAREVWPAPDQHPPINARLVVSYTMGHPATFAPVPAVGPDVVLLDMNGARVDADVQAMVGANAIHHVVIRPTAALLPNHGYQLADRRTIPCIASSSPNACELNAAPTPFASFTTADDSDTAAPSFAGLSAVADLGHQTCDSDSCCGNYDVFLTRLSWPKGTDDRASTDLRYNVYRQGNPSVLVGPLVKGEELLGDVVCSGTRNGLRLESGDYLVRGVDWAGNEDSNGVSHRIADGACAGPLPGCAVAAPARDRAAWPLLFVAAVIWACRLRRWRGRS